MLMRDYGFEIYKALMRAPEKKEEEKKDKRSADDKSTKVQKGVGDDFVLQYLLKNCNTLKWLHYYIFIMYCRMLVLLKRRRQMKKKNRNPAKRFHILGFFFKHSSTFRLILYF